MNNWKYTEKEFDRNEINNFQKHHNIKFPQEYLAMLDVANGASPEKNILKKDSQEFVVSYFFSWSKGSDINFIENNSFFHEIHSQEVIPFANDPFGNFFCFFYGNNDTPSIVFWEHEQDSIVELSTNFCDFITALE